MKLEGFRRLVIRGGEEGGTEDGRFSYKESESWGWAELEKCRA